MHDKSISIMYVMLSRQRHVHRTIIIIYKHTYFLHYSRWSRKIDINSTKVNMWCVLFYDLVIGIYFFNQPIIKQENV